MLRADVKMAYAELASVRAQADLVRRSRAILEQVVDVSREMLAVGKGRQPDVLRGQIEYQKMREMLLMLENRERLLSIRLNTLAAFPPDSPVPAIDHLAEFPTAYDPLELQSIYREDRPARKAVKARIGKGRSGSFTQSTRAGRTSRCPPPTCSGTRCPTGRRVRTCSPPWCR